MANLYELHSRMQELMNLAISSALENEGHIDDCIDAELDDWGFQLAEKQKQYFFAIKNIDADAMACKAESKRLAERASAYEALSRRLKSYLALTIPAEGIKTTHFSGYWKRTKAVAYSETFDPATLPVEYQRVKVEPKANEIKEAIIAGTVIDGVSVVENNTLVLR